MKSNQMKEEFDKWEAIVELRRLEKKGSLLEQADAKSKLKYFWFVWEVCWPIAFKAGEFQYDE